MFYRNKKDKSLSLLVSAFALIAAFASCKQRNYNSTKSVETGTDVSNIKIIPENSPKTFRDIFYTYSKSTIADDKRTEAVQHMVYMPDKSLIETKVAGPSSGNPLQPLTEMMAKIKPSDLYKTGVNTPMQDIANLDGALTAEKPITIVIVPGIFGEFIRSSPYQEVFDTDNSAKKNWKSLTTETSDKNLTVDAVYSLDKLSDVPTKLNDLVAVSSIDNAAGKPLVNIIFLKPLFASLETLIPLRQATRIYERRLKKTFELLGAPQNVYLMGYSRGGCVALDMVSVFSKEQYKDSWMKNLKGVVTLGGVIYGSGLADEMMADMSSRPDNEIARSLNWLVNKLQDTSSGGNDPVNNAKKVAENSFLWAQETNKIAGIVKGKEAHPGFTAENISSDLPNVGALVALTTQFALQNLHLEKPISDYYSNIARFKEFGKQALDGINSLTTAERTKWWRTNTIPTNIKYFALTGTMPEPTTPGKIPHELTGNTHAYNSRSIDYSILRKSYYDLYKVTNQQLNDSQVSLDKSRFWPQIHRNLNHSQPDFKSYWLGVMGTDHWGMAFPVAFQTTSVGASPFPRTNLIKSVATFLALSQE